MSYSYQLSNRIGFKEKAFLDLLIYLSKKSKSTFKEFGDLKFVYNSLDAWLELSPALSKSTLRRIIKKLEEMQLIVIVQSKTKYCPNVKYYAVNTPVYEQLLDDVAGKKTKTKTTQSRIESTESVTPTSVSTTETSDLNADQLISTWNEIFSSSLKFEQFKLSNTPEIKQKVISVISLFYDLEEWKQYAFKINSSKFLMGEKENANFQSTIHWLLKPETIKDVFSGKYTLNDRKLDQNNIAHNVITAEKQLIETVTFQSVNHLQNGLNTAQMQQDRAEFKRHIKDCFFDVNILDQNEFGLKSHLEYGGFNRNTFMMYVSDQTLSDKEQEKIEQAFVNKYLAKKYSNLTKNETETIVTDQIKTLREHEQTQADYLHRLVVLKQNVLHRKPNATQKQTETHVAKEEMQKIGKHSADQNLLPSESKIDHQIEIQEFRDLVETIYNKKLTPETDKYDLADRLRYVKSSVAEFVEVKEFDKMSDHNKEIMSLHYKHFLDKKYNKNACVNYV